jgi:hypothetical protein
LEKDYIKLIRLKVSDVYRGTVLKGQHSFSGRGLELLEGNVCGAGEIIPEFDDILR